MNFCNKHIVQSSFLMLLITLNQIAIAQNKFHDTLKMDAIIYQGDTIPYAVLSNIFVYSTLTDQQKRAINQYNRLRNAVYLTYPYARKAGVILNDINARIEKISDNNSKKKYIKSREKELKKEFTTPLVNMTIFEGKILMKLINRETGNNCYEIIKEYRGGLTARLCQTVAFFFDGNLKQPYDSRNDDLVIERIVREVQRLYGYNEISKRQSL